MKEHQSTNQFSSETAIMLTMVLLTIVMQVAQFLSWVLGLESDANAIISNGRVCKPIFIIFCLLCGSLFTIYLLLVLVPVLYL